MLDFTSVVSGPFCTQALGDYGADVVKVESLVGDMSRSTSGPFHAGLSGFFSQFNTWLALTSYRRATCETETPGTRVCAQNIRFSSSSQFRRLRRVATKHSANVHLIADAH